MGTEIERRFLVHGEPWKDLGLTGTHFIQGYLSTEQERTVRVRLCGERAYIAIKANLNNSFTRVEYEYEIPTLEARIILDTLAQKPIIEKIRYYIPHGDDTWEVDVFLGENSGLVLAELELKSENQTIIKPNWLGEEVTQDKKYLNACLVARPYTTWNTR